MLLSSRWQRRWDLLKSRLRWYQRWKRLQWSYRSYRWYRPLLRHGFEWGKAYRYTSSRLIAPMIGRPFSSTNIAKLVSAATCHVIAALILLKHHPALLTLSKFKVILQEKYTILVALACVNRHHTFPAKSNLTYGTQD